MYAFPRSTHFPAQAVSCSVYELVSSLSSIALSKYNLHKPSTHVTRHAGSLYVYLHAKPQTSLRFLKQQIFKDVRFNYDNIFKL